MFGPLIEFLERLTTKFTWARLGVLIGTLTTIGICLWVYESYTAHFRLERLEHEAGLLERVAAAAADSGKVGVPGLAAARDRLVAEVNEVIGQRSSGLAMSKPLRKALAAAAPWVLMTLLMTMASGKTLQTSLYLGVAVLALPFIVLGASLPDFNPSWINYVAYPIGHWVVVVAAITAWSRRRARAPS